jgi:putative tryptophan/tyrosine transport system substrate-binding protein
LRLHVLHAGIGAEIEAAFAGFAQLRSGVLPIGADAFFNAKSRPLAELSLRDAVPAIYEYNEFAKAGGLMSYGTSIEKTYRWAGIYMGRILKGDNLGRRESIKAMSTNATPVQRPLSAVEPPIAF